MNFGVCHSCGGGKEVVYCDGHCNRAFCEKCIDVAMGDGMHELYTLTDVEFICLSCLQEKHTCWTCGADTRGICGLGLHMCAACEGKQPNTTCCIECGGLDKIITCYYCLNGYHRECSPQMLRVDEYSDLTAGVCLDCQAKQKVFRPSEFHAASTNVADVHPYQALLAESSSLGRLARHLKDEILQIPVCPEYKSLISQLCGTKANQQALECIPGILNTLPLRSYTLDVMEWLLVAIDAVYGAFYDGTYAYEAVEQALQPYLVLEDDILYVPGGNHQPH